MPGTRLSPDPLTSEHATKPTAERAVPPFKVMRAASANTRMMQMTLRELMAHKRWVFAAMALAFGLSTFWYWTHPPLYGSTVSFYVLTSPVQDKEVPIYLSLQTDAVTLRHIATSTAMFDHLIDRYGLQAHYGVPAGSTNERAWLHQTLEAHVTVDLRESDIVSVLVKDSDRMMAAALANGIFAACDSMLRAEQQAQLNGQLRIYEQVMDSTERSAKVQTTELLRMIDELRSLRTEGLTDHYEASRAADAEQVLMDAASDVAGIKHELVVQHRNHTNLFMMAKDPVAGPVRLKSRATEDLGPSALWRSVQWILTITTAVGFLVTAVILLLIETWTTPEPEAAPMNR